MAQPQVQTRKSSGESRSATNALATQSAGQRLGLNEPSTWAASPFGLMRRLSDDMDQLIGQVLGVSLGASPLLSDAGTGYGPRIQWTPPVELFERDGKLVIQAELPGLGVNDVSVEVTEGLVTISGERREQREIDDKGFRRTERRYGCFSRGIPLPDGVRAEDVQATFRDGVLELTAPLPQSASQSRTVEIKNESGSDGTDRDGGQADSEANGGSGRDTAVSGGANPGKTAGGHARGGA